jgi:hypothetical protein
MARLQVTDERIGAFDGMRISRGKLKYSEKSFPNATITTSNLT